MPKINQNPLPAYIETHMIEIVRKDGESGISTIPVPHTSKSFVKSGVAKFSISSIPKPIIEGGKELIKNSQSLFGEVAMVEIGEGSSNTICSSLGRM